MASPSGGASLAAGYLLVVPSGQTSESVLPRMMAKLEHLGCAKPVVGLVIPSGYSFNLDGTSIYLTQRSTT